jgi:hypothetical protein
MLKTDGYIRAFVRFWSANPAVKKIWMSLFTPQKGAANDESLTPEQRKSVVETLLRIRQEDTKLDMPEGMIKEFLSPPASPEHCIFARTTLSLSADLKTRIGPCQFGGDPDCSQCGCIASMGLAAVGHHKLLGPLSAGDVFWSSMAIGQHVQHAESAWHRLMSRGRDSESDHGPERAPELLKVIR